MQKKKPKKIPAKKRIRAVTKKTRVPRSIARSSAAVSLPIKKAHPWRWRKPLTSLIHRLFNFDPDRDFGILDELVGGLFVLLLLATTITVIYGKEVTTTWVETMDADWKKGELHNLSTVIESGTNTKLTLQKTDGGWTIHAKPTSENITAIAMSSATMGFAVGENGTMLRTNNAGESWSSVTSGTSEGLWAVSVDGSTGFAVGNNGVIVKWNGSAWQEISSPSFSTLLSVAIKNGKGFAVGEGGKILKWEGAGWEEDTSPTEKTLFGVSYDGSRAFAVGEGGTIVSWENGTWTTLVSPVTKALVAVRLLSSTFGIAVGETGTIVHWDGSTWKKKTSGTTRDLNTVAITSRQAALAGGSDGTIVRWNGTGWTAEPLGSGESIFGIALPTNTTAALVGSTGLAATYRSAIYAEEGVYTSPTKDAEKEVVWDMLQWNSTAPAGTSIQFQVAANNNNVWLYLGPDGTVSSYYTNNAGQKIAAEHAQKRYFRYRAYLKTTDTSVTPSLQSVTITSKEEVEEAPPKPVEEEKVVVEEKKEETPQTLPPAKDIVTPSSVPEEQTPATPLAPETPIAPPPPSGGGGGGGTTPIQQRIATTILEPTPNALLQAEVLLLRWEAITGVSSYNLQIDRDTSFVSPFINTTLTSTSFVSTPPLSSGSYFWRVRPEISETNERRSDWSSIATFTLTDKPPLPKVASPTLTKEIGVDSSTIAIDGIAFPGAHVRLIITSNIVEKTVVADDNGAWHVELPRALFSSGQHLAQAQIFTTEGQVTPAITVGEFFIPFPPPPSKNAAVATARAIGAAATQAADATKKAAKKTVEETVIVAEKTQKIIQENETETKVALTATVPVVTVANPTVLPMLSNLHLLFYHFFSGVLSLFGIRKKRRAWGIVYDAITKEPIGLAIIRLFDGQKKLIETQVTDNEGRFGFLVQPSSYTLEVVKQDFAFPSKLVTGKIDSDFEDCYHGEALTTKEGAINVSVPLDPLNRKEARKKQPLFLALKSTMHALSLPLLIIGWTSSWIVVLLAYSATNLGMTFIYLFFAIIHVVLLPKKFRPWGTVFAANSLEPVPLAVISIIDTKFNRVLKSRLTDYSGRFNFLPPAGEYKLTVKKEGFDFPSKSKPETRKFRNLYFGQNIIVKKEKAIVSTDVPVEKK